LVRAVNGEPGVYVVLSNLIIVPSAPDIEDVKFVAVPALNGLLILYWDSPLFPKDVSAPMIPTARPELSPAPENA
jgi:hypothetical protein